MRNQKCTGKFQVPLFSEIKRDFTRFLSSHVLNILYTKQQTFFVFTVQSTKIEKKNPIVQEKKNESVARILV